MTLTRPLLALTCLLALAFFAGPGHAQQDLRPTLFADADRAQAAAKAMNAELLAPATFGRAVEAYMAADADLARGRNLERVKSALATATKAFNDAAQAAEIANVTLAAVIKTRGDATRANAGTFAADGWRNAEAAFDSAARRLETGDIRGAHSRADQAEALYRDAELTAIKAQYLSQTRALLAEAEQQRVPRLAPTTYEKARSLLAQAEKELNENRYDTDLPRSLAQQANYEARHAIYLAKLIGMMRDDGDTLEDVILRYEDPVTQISGAADRVAQFDKGIEPVVMELVTYIEALARAKLAEPARSRRHAPARRRARGRDPRARPAARRRVAGTRGARATARGRGADPRAVHGDREHVRPRPGARIARRQSHGHSTRGPHFPERPGRGAGGVPRAPRESERGDGGVSSLADRDRGTHGLVRQRRDEPGVVAPPRGGGRARISASSACRRCA